MKLITPWIARWTFCLLLLAAVVLPQVRASQYPLNTFSFDSCQAGSTTDIDNLTIKDLDTDLTIYENAFDSLGDATRNLNLYYWPTGVNPAGSNYVLNGPMTRVVNGKLRLETTALPSHSLDMTSPEP